MMKILLSSFLLLFLLSACGEDEMDPPEILMVEEVENPNMRVTTRSDCPGGVLSTEPAVLVKFYKITTMWDFSDRDSLEEHITDPKGNLEVYLDDGNYYCEVTRQGTGEEVLSGVFSLPYDLDIAGKLQITKGIKSGLVRSGQTIVTDAVLTHTNEITGEEFVSTSDEFGSICMALNPGRYIVKVEHEDYKTYTTGGGYSVFPMGYKGTSNYELERK